MTFWRHRINGVGAGGELWVTTLHSRSTGTLADAHAAFNTFAVTLFTGAFAARWNTNTGMTGTVTDQLDPTTGRNVAQARTDVTHLGTATDAPQSPRACAVIGLKTATPTRAGRGRMFLPAPTAASITAAGVMSDAARAALITAVSVPMVTLAATVIPVILHRATLLATDVTSIQVGNELGTQRRRTNKTVNVYGTAAV